MLNGSSGIIFVVLVSYLVFSQSAAAYVGLVDHVRGRLAATVPRLLGTARAVRVKCDKESDWIHRVGNGKFSEIASGVAMTLWHYRSIPLPLSLGPEKLQPDRLWNELKWYWTEPRQGNLNYRDTDELLNLCISRNIQVRGVTVSSRRWSQQFSHLYAL
ncbi:GH10 domain-containing protein [Forsythia ovata]|uniref:GH10 domain-containing protein n=1 Tax=Forsythia ovata TaxID=205694 RepID=A0ABD1U8K7_9LAMI